MNGHSLLEFLREFLGFLRERKRFWLLPLLLVLLLMGLLVFLTQGSAVAPRIYGTL
ncbi:MAG: hypothetical protein IPO09_09235 [Anaeromyxobacter sp.]|nr:hypothetical protein [Anaeromyxobacter sp.]MBL0277584.1 hypothetical protein [Anaeromyxobacter sp.]